MGAVNSVMNSLTGIMDVIGGIDGLGGLMGAIQVPLIEAQDFISSSNNSLPVKRRLSVLILLRQTC